MGNIPVENDSRAGCGVKCLVAIRDTCPAFHDENVLILILMDVHGCAVTRARADLNDRIAYTSPNLPGIQAAISVGLGVSILPEVEADLVRQSYCPLPFSSRIILMPPPRLERK
jgi:DNA-binding transcriptional LysR family regulator